MANRLKLHGNHSKEHAGCAAVWRVMNRQAFLNGWEVVESDDYDALIVNGEGSMHHGNRGWGKKMKVLREALDKGKDAYLLNTVWQKNPRDDILKNLSGISVREVLSANELKEKHGISARTCPDFSYFNFSSDFGKPTRGIACTDYWTGRTWGLLGYGEFIDIAEMTWKDFVETVAKYELLVTGRHHGVYAACVAKRPFLAIKGNTHKIEGLIASAGAKIPVADSPDELDLEARYDYKPIWDWLDQPIVFPKPGEKWNG